jgi:hypothetical protein
LLIANSHHATVHSSCAIFVEVALEGDAEACLLQDLGWSQAEAADMLTRKSDFERLSGRPRPTPTA